MTTESRKVLHTSVIVGVSALGCPMSWAGHNATTVLTPNTIQISAGRGLAFGRLLNDLMPGSAETVSFTSDGSAIAARGNVIPVGGTVQPAGFTLSASESDMVGQSVTVSASALSAIGAGTATLPWRWLKVDYNATKTAQATQQRGASLAATLTSVAIPTAGNPLDVFGAIEIDGSDTDGAYSGTITVTVNHQ